MNPDFLVIGAGVAGLRAAIELADAGRVLVVAKDSLKESSSQYAQGGIAVALSDDDDVCLHEQDTLYAGDGLCDVEAVRALVQDGPGAIEQLIEWGVTNVSDTLSATTAAIEARLAEMGIAANPARAPHYLSLRFPGGIDDEIEARLAADEVHVSLRGDRMRITPHLYNHE